MRVVALVLLLALVLPCVPAMAEAYSAMVTSSKMQVFKNAALTGRNVYLDKGSVVRVLAQKDNVVQMRYKGYVIYGRLSDLTPIADMAVKATVSVNTRVYEKASTSSRSTILKKGTELYVLAVNKSAAMVEKNGVIGYTYVSCLSMEKNDFDQDGEPSGGLEGGEETGGKIEYSGSSVVIETIAAVVNVNSLPVYKSASTSSKKYCNLSYGQNVNIRAYNSKWAYIELNGKYGFCALAGLIRANSYTEEEKNPFDEPASGDPALDNAIPATVTSATLAVYASPSTSAKKLGTLQKGIQVNVIKYNSKWAYIELSGNYGYCAVAGLTRNSEMSPDELPDSSKEEIDAAGAILGVATVVTATAPMYDRPDTSADSTTLAMGTAVNVHKYNSTWGYCSVNNKLGYIPLKYLSPDSYAALESGDSGAAVTSLEKALLKLGYFDGTPGTSYNSNTTTAVERFQEACGMTVSGMADVNTLRVLYAGYAPASPLLSLTIKLGDKNTNVTRLQTRLYSLGYYSKSSSVDGDFGSNTAAAVKLFQSAASLSSTGTADPATLKVLYSEKAPSLPSGKTPADGSTSQTGTATGSGSNGNTTVMPSELASSTSSYSSSSSNAQKLEYVIYVGQNQLGKKYVFATSGPNTYDCSGFTKYCFGKIGKSLPHSAKSQGYNESTGTKILDAVDLVRGDLVFFNTSADSDLCDHVGIYLGSNRFIHAGSGAGKVIVSKLNSSYYSRVYSWGRRVLNT